MRGYRIFQIKKDKDGKETQGIYPQNDKHEPIIYENRDDAIADYEIRLGQAMATDNTDLATFLMVLDEVIGKDACKAYVAKTHTETDKEGKEIEVKYEISPRLIDVKVTKDGEVPNIAKYDTVNDVHSNFHLKLGRAMQNPDVMAIALCGVGTLGGSLDTTHWVRTAPMAEPAPEPEVPEE